MPHEYDGKVRTPSGYVLPPEPFDGLEARVCTLERLMRSLLAELRELRLVNTGEGE